MSVIETTNTNLQNVRIDEDAFDLTCSKFVESIEELQDRKNEISETYKEFENTGDQLSKELDDTVEYCYDMLHGLNKELEEVYGLLVEFKEMMIRTDSYLSDQIRCDITDDVTYCKTMRTTGE